MPAVDPGVSTDAYQNGRNGQWGVQQGNPRGPRPTDAYYALTTSWNVIQGLNAETLTLYMDQFRRGWIRALSMLIEILEGRDDSITTELGKRRGAVASRAKDFQLVPKGGKSAAKDRKVLDQKEKLKFFFDNLKVSNAMDLDIDGGFSLFCDYSMSAMIQGHCAFEIVPRVIDGQISAQCMWVPNRFLERTHGAMRYAGPVSAMGVPITGNDPVFAPDSKDKPRDSIPTDKGGWIILAHAHPIIEALCVLFLYKSVAMRDLMAYLRRFGAGYLLGVIDAPPGSAPFNLFMEQLNSMTAGGVLVVSGGAESGADASVKHEAPSSSGELAPMQFLEMVGRKITAICRGSEQATGMRQRATGVTAQIGEMDGAESRDCEWMSEQCQKIAEWAVKILDGPNAELLVDVVIAPRSQKDFSLDIATDTFLIAAGVAMSKDTLAERYDRENEDDTAPEDLAVNPQGASEQGEEEAATPDARSNDRPSPGYAAALAAGAKMDLAKVKAGLIHVLAAATDEEHAERMTELAKTFPDVVSQIERASILADVSEKVVADTFAKALRKEAA